MKYARTVLRVPYNYLIKKLNICSSLLLAGKKITFDLFIISYRRLQSSRLNCMMAV